MKLRLIIFFLFSVVVLRSAIPQVDEPFFSNYNYYYITESEGVPHSFVDDIICDSDGFIWMATHNGIGRYDGYQVLSFNTQTEPLRLKNDFVHKLCEDNFRRLWIGSEGGLEVLDLDTYAFVDFFSSLGDTLRQLSDGYIHSLYKDKKGDLWISCGNNLWCMELDKNGDVGNYYCLAQPCSSPIKAVIDMGHAICAGLDNQVYVLEKKDGHLLEAVPLSDSLEPFSEDWRISCMLEDGDFLWIGTNRGLFKYNVATSLMQRYRYSTHRPGMLSQAYITDIKMTGQGHIIVSTLNGINVYHRETDEFSFIRQNSALREGTINCNAVDCIYTDGETIWLGTETGGANLLSLKRLQTILWYPPQVPFVAGETFVVNDICEDGEGNLWISMLERGLACWNPETNDYKGYLFSPNDPNSLTNNTINGLFVDSDHHLWAYTWGVGINELDLNRMGNRSFRRYTREEFATLKGDFISSACEDVINGGIWFGSTRGVLFYDKATKTFERVLFDGIENEFEMIPALYVDRKRRLWIGTTRGLLMLDLFSYARSHKNFRYTYFKYELDEPKSMRLEKINSILEDGEGTLWLGGNGSGLYKVSENERGHFDFTNYTVRNGLPDNTVIGMTRDGQGNLWIVTHDGICKLNVMAMSFTNYTAGDGLPFTQYSWNGIHYSSRYDRIYVATNMGMLVIRPEELDSPSVDRVVKLTSLTIAGNPIYPSSGDYLKQNITKASSITLHEKESRFSIGLATCDYGSRNRIRFSYRMKGYEREWNETRPGDCVIRYTAVPPGHYVLQVCATNETGQWSGQVAEIDVRIIPYIYKTGWFYVGVVVVLCVLAWWFYRWKTKRYRAQRAELKQKVEERTQELAVQNRQLEVMAEQVKEATEEKIAFFTNITHEFRTPVTLIHGPIEHALKVVKDEEVKKQLEIAERNSGYLLSLVNELMDFRKLDMNKVVLDRRACNFVEFISELLLPFKVFARERGIEVCLYTHIDHPCVLIDVAYMRKALVNLVANAVKFTPDNGCIDVFVAAIPKRGQVGPQLYVNVCDTGSGIVESDMDRIFDRFFQSKSSEKHPVFGQSGTGIGLFLCKRIIELHGGVIFARNNQGRGASFRVLLPLLQADCELLPQSPGHVVEHEQMQMEGEEGVHKETVLVVEDNKDMRAYVCTLLSKDYRVLEAEHGEEALRIVQKHTVDLIVSDLMMPVMDGMELSRCIKDNLLTSHIPFLMLTAISSDVQEKKSFEIGVDEYICKPFDEEVFLLRIRNILNQRNRYKKRFSTSGDVSELHIKEESRDQLFVNKAIELMKKNYADSEYNLESFVRDMGYSKTLVNSKMHALVGQPIGQFMKNYRLNVAQQMMQERKGDINVSEVAYAVGFNDPKYFTKCFKEFFGYLPSRELKKN